MKRAMLVRGMQVSALAIAVSAAALLVFTSANLATIFSDNKFWTTVAVAGVGGFLGSLLFGNTRLESK